MPLATRVVQFSSEDRNYTADSLLEEGPNAVPWLTDPEVKNNLIRITLQLKKPCRLSSIRIGVMWFGHASVLLSNSTFKSTNFVPFANMPVFGRVNSLPPEQSCFDVKLDKGKNKEHLPLWDQKWDLIKIQGHQLWPKGDQLGISYFEVDSDPCDDEMASDSSDDKSADKEDDMPKKHHRSQNDDNGSSSDNKDDCGEEKNCASQCSSSPGPSHSDGNDKCSRPSPSPQDDKNEKRSRPGLSPHDDKNDKSRSDTPNEELKQNEKKQELKQNEKKLGNNAPNPGRPENNYRVPNPAAIKAFRHSRACSLVHPVPAKVKKVGFPHGYISAVHHFKQKPIEQDPLTKCPCGNPASCSLIKKRKKNFKEDVLEKTREERDGTDIMKVKQDEVKLENNAANPGNPGPSLRARVTGFINNFRLECFSHAPSKLKNVGSPRGDVFDVHYIQPKPVERYLIERPAENSNTRHIEKQRQRLLKQSMCEQTQAERDGTNITEVKQDEANLENNAANPGNPGPSFRARVTVFMNNFWRERFSHAPSKLKNVGSPHGDISHVHDIKPNPVERDQTECPCGNPLTCHKERDRQLMHLQAQAEQDGTNITLPQEFKTFFNAIKCVITNFNNVSVRGIKNIYEILKPCELNSYEAMLFEKELGIFKDLLSNQGREMCIDRKSFRETQL